MKTPIVSVIIPSRNEFPNIAFTVQSIINDLETFLEPSEFEIIIVANCCTDEVHPRRGLGGTVDYLMPRGVYWNRVLRVVYDPIAGNHSTRNYGALLARGKYLFFSDGHMSYKRGFFKKMIRAIDETDGIAHGTIGWLGAYPLGTSMGYQYTIKLGEEIKGCVDEKTEILTKSGWKRWNEVSYNTEFACVKMVGKDAKTIEYQKPRDLVIRDYEGKMIEIKQQNYDALLTPNHRCFYQSKELRRKNTRSDYEWRVKFAENLQSNNFLPVSTKGINKTCGFLKDEMVELIGWIITEGNYGKDDTIIITQFISKNRTRIKQLLDLLQISYCIKGKKQDFKIHQNDARFIKRFLPRKELTNEFLLQCSYSQLCILYETLIGSDGTRTKSNDKFIQTNEKTIDAFQTLCILLGFQSKKYTRKPKYFKGNHYGKKDLYYVSVKKSDWASNLKIVEKEYKGKVWCPDLQNGNIFIKRNGQTAITGNTWNNHKLADDYFYISLQGHCCLGVKKEQFLKFDGYPVYHRCYGGGEFYLDIKWWLFGSNVVVVPDAIGYHLCAPRGYTYHHDDYKFNVLAIGMAIGADAWTERAYINWCKKGKPEVMKRLWNEAKQATKKDKEFIKTKSITTFNDLLVDKPWDKLNQKRYGKSNSSMLIFHDTILPSFKGTPAEKLYKESKQQKELEKFIYSKLENYVYKRGYKEPKLEDKRTGKTSS